MCVNIVSAPHLLKLSISTPPLPLLLLPPLPTPLLLHQHYVLLRTGADTDDRLPHTLANTQQSVTQTKASRDFYFFTSPWKKKSTKEEMSSCRAPPCAAGHSSMSTMKRASERKKEKEVSHVSTSLRSASVSSDDVVR